MDKQILKGLIEDSETLMGDLEVIEVLNNGITKAEDLREAFTYSTLVLEKIPRLKAAVSNLSNFLNNL